MTAHVVTRVRNNAWASAGMAGAIGAAAALASSVPLPRGPVTAMGAIAVIAASVLVGIAAGWITRSRWAFVACPAAYVIAYELTRIGGIGGAAFGPVRLDTVYGIVALVAGRGVHWLLALLPMLAGIALGRALARPHEARSFVFPLLLGVGTLLLGIVVAIPGSTPPVVDAGGARIPGSIAELTTVTLNGREQAISIRLRARTSRCCSTCRAARVRATSPSPARSSSP